MLEYLAARRQKEEESLQAENLVPLSEYGRNCHVRPSFTNSNYITVLTDVRSAVRL